MNDKSLANAVLSPTLPSAQLIADSAKLPKKEAPKIADEISELAQQIRSGDNTYLEELLLAQAASLNAFSADCLMKASGFIQEGLVAKFPELTQSLAQLGLKAQDQSRKTVLALHELRNPKKPSQFIKNYVHQQLNQVQAELKNKLEAGHNAEVDTRIKRTTETVDPEMEAVGIQHGTSD